MTNTAGLMLVISDKPDIERNAVAKAWKEGGGEVLRLGRFWEPPHILTATNARPYGADTFCLVLAQKLELSPISPNDDLLLQLPDWAIKRRLQMNALKTVCEGSFPIFVKPATPKLFAAGVHASPETLLTATKGLSADTLALTSEVVQFL